MYTVMYHRRRHLPEIRYDTYDITSWVMAIGNNPMMITLSAHGSHTAVVRGAVTKAQCALTTGALVILVHKGQDSPFTITLSPRLMPDAP